MMVMTTFKLEVVAGWGRAGPDLRGPLSIVYGGRPGGDRPDGTYSTVQAPNIDRKQNAVETWLVGGVHQ